MHKLAQTVLGYVRKHDLLRAGDRVGVAVSGGADSVGMLSILLELRRELGVVVSVVHLNHMLRGAESDEDEQFVRALAAAYELEIVCETRDVKAFAAENKLSVESSARQLRYEFFRKAQGERCLDKIATAHTLDDQAETVLLKLLRGAGTRGLAGIYPKLAVSHQPSVISRQPLGSKTITETTAFIVRPFLSVRRPDIESYLSELGQTWREDSSNRELRHTRNRIRHEMLPCLEQLNPRVRETLAEDAEIARSEEEYWAAQVSNFLPQAWNCSDDAGILHWGKIAQLDSALKRRLIRAAAESLGVNLEFRHIEEVLALSEENRRAALPGEWSASWRNGEIRFDRRIKTTGDYEYMLIIPGTVTVPEAKVTITAEVLSLNDVHGNNHRNALNSNFASKSLVVRNWRAGDRFWPQNAKQSKKIKELLQDRHITGEEKKSWPMVASGSEVVWLRGSGAGRDFQAGGGKCVLIQAIPIGSRASSP